MVSSFEGAAGWLSVTGSGSDGAGVSSGEAASVVSTGLASFGTSASYADNDDVVRSELGPKTESLGTYDSLVDRLL